MTLPNLPVWLLDRLPLWLLRILPPALTQLPAPPAPPIVFTDESGVGWREMPDYLDPWYADRGQHDTWKREMRLAVLRWRKGNTTQGTVDLRDYGLSEQPRRTPVPMLIPFHVQLADACRRLGFYPLYLSAVEDGEEEEARALWLAAEAGATAEAEARFARNSAVASKWDVATRGPFVFESVEEVRAMHTCGPFLGDATPRPRSPLLPLVLQAASDPSTYMHQRKP